MAKKEMNRREFMSSSVKASVGAGIASSFLSASLLKPRTAKASGKTIRYWSWLNPKDTNPRAEVQTQVIKDFEEKTGIKVNVEVFNWKTIPQQLMRAVQAGEGPDVVRLYSLWLSEQAAAKNIISLDPFLTDPAHLTK